MTEPEIRPLSSHAERVACVALQEAIWGAGFADRVPASILMVTAETGGIASGAFDGDRLVGFVFGITGIRDGQPVHWSDMLAVLPSHRDRGLGFRLKVHQRDLLLRRGVETVLWTFDPLEARNGHLNFRRLGARSREYRRDVYGDSDSPLHAGIGTDRLVVRWELAADGVRARLEGGTVEAGPSVGPVLNPPSPGGDLPRPSRTIAEPVGETVRVAIPAHLQRLKAADLGLAAAWRRNLRAALERCLEAGYAVVDLERGDRVACYVLTRVLER